MKTKLIHDNFQNYKRYGIQKAQLIIADMNRKSYGFEVNTKYYNEAMEKMLSICEEEKEK